MKVPAARFEETVAFYRDTLGLPIAEHEEPTSPTVSRSVRVEFGPCTLWLDRVDNYAKADLWLELHTDALPNAVQHLAEHGVRPQDELEEFPDGSEAHWICNPVGVPHVLHAPSE